MPIDFKWYFDGRPVKEYSGITTVKLGNRNSVLNIDSVTGKHAGNYTCQASNLADSLNFTSELIVKGTPNIKLIKKFNFFLLKQASTYFYILFYSKSFFLLFDMKLTMNFFKKLN